MDDELKNRWVAALRSGHFKQGRGQLIEGDRYCCLGVLCSVANIKVDASGIGAWDPVTKRYNYNEIERVTKDSGLDYWTLWKLNDENKMTFNQIADYIEETFRA